MEIPYKNLIWAEFCGCFLALLVIFFSAFGLHKLDAVMASWFTYPAHLLPYAGLASITRVNPNPDNKKSNIKNMCFEGAQHF